MKSISAQTLNNIILKIKKENREVTLESISKELTRKFSLRCIAEIIHALGLHYQVSDFYGSICITYQAEYIYNFLKGINPEIEIVHNKEIDNLVYLQLYIPEKDTCILIDYTLKPKMTKSKIIKLSKDDFSDIFLLTKTKLLLINALGLEKKLILDKNEIDILKYIEQNKNMTHKELYSKLYTKLLDKMMKRTYTLLQNEETILFSKGITDFKYIKLKEEIINTKKHLQNLTSYYDDTKGGTIFG